MIVQRLCDLPTIPAPKEWEILPEIAAAKPYVNGFPLELRKVFPLGNVAVWQRRTGAFSSTASEMFFVGDDDDGSDV